MLPRIDLYEELLKLLNQIPPGKVATCTVLADALGDPLASRAIPEMLRELQRRGAPVHRVVHVDGTPVLPEAVDRLADEGIPVVDGVVRGLEVRVFKDFESRKPLRDLRNLQVEVASKVVLEDVLDEPVRRVAGVDVSYRGRKAYGACVLWDVEDSVPVGQSTSEVKVRFPYIPTYLSFREGPAMVEAVKPLLGRFDVLMVNGHGIAHPYRCGIASHLGVTLDVPSVGVARSLLPGFQVGEPVEAGWRPVVHGRTVVGAAVKPSADIKPVYVSPGHKVSLETSLDVALKCFRGHRLPEPLRLAHSLASRLRKAG